MPPKLYQVQPLLEKMVSPDQDFRFMALDDLMKEVSHDRNFFANDEASEVKVLNQVLALIEDKISEVKNQAVKCLGQLIKIIRESNLNLVVTKLTQFLAGKEDELRDVAGLALKTVVSELPSDGKLAQSACAKLVPKLLEQLQQASTPPETLVETLSTLGVLVTRFPQHTAAAAQDPLSSIAPLLEHARPVVRKRAIVTLAQFLPIATPTRFSELLKTNIVPGLAPSTKVEKQQTIVQLVGAIGRYAPHNLEPILGDVVPGVLKAATRDDSDLRESSLQTLETLVLRCPSAITTYIPSILTLASELVKYDPNYSADADDEDEDMNDADEDEDDEDVADDYSDDEDVSYKVRRSATKCIAAVVGTRPELLTSVYRTVSPVLISRFGDREDSVKLEIWSTYGLLIKQTGVYGGASVEGSTRKRSNEGMEVEDSPTTLLKSQVPALSKALLKQLSPKTSTANLQAGFTLLQSLVQVLPGSLSAQADGLCTISASVLSSTSNNSTAALQSTVLSFLTPFFSTHPAAAYQTAFPKVLPALLVMTKQRHPRVAADAFKTFSALLTSLKPVESGDWVSELYTEVVNRLRTGDTDVEVRQRAEDVVADLWLNATIIMQAKDGSEWDALMKSGRVDGAIGVIGKVADNVDMDPKWSDECLIWAIDVLKRPGKAGKAAAFGCLEILLRKESQIPGHIPADLVPLLQGFLSLNDLVLLQHALITLTICLTLAPKDTFPLVESGVMPLIYPIAHSPLVSGSTLETLTDFLSALVTADREISSHVVPGLVVSLEKTDGTDVSPSNVSKCISAVVRGAPDIAAGMIAEFSKAIKPGTKSKELHIILSLLALGEIGRTIDMARQPEVFNNALAFFTADAESLRSAAAFAVGNVAVGNIQHFFPILLKEMQDQGGKQLLALNAMKEVVTHCPRGHLEQVASALWAPLFEVSHSEDETTRNVAAACIGQLTTANPSQYLPELKERLGDSSASVRATVVAAVRYTFTDSSQTYDDLLAPLIMQFVALIHDEDLTVRRLSLLTLNAAARNKPHLIREHLATVMPLLYGETKMKPELVRIVEMGPWKHRVDDGLEARKTAYETLYTILDTCVDKIDVHEFLTYVIEGLKDEANEIKVLCHMMLFRLAQVASTAVSQRLDDLAPQLAEGMKSHNVEKNTVKQDVERTTELQRSTLRAIAALSKISTPGSAPAFDKVVDSVSRNGSQWHQEFRELL